MWPSQRVQNFSGPATSATATIDSQFKSHLDVSRTGLTSKIEIRHTRLNSPSDTKTVTYISDTKSHRGGTVAFADSILRTTESTAPGGIGDGEQSGVSVFASRSSVISSRLLSKSNNLSHGNVHDNEVAGHVVIQTLCNRDSIIQGLGAQCTCPVIDVQVNEENLKRIQEMEPDRQQGELCKLMIKLVEEREDRNDQLVSIQAQQKLVTAAKPRKHHKVRHILCIKGRTIDGTDITGSHFPNSFVDVSKLTDLRRDPSEFKRFTAKVDMRGFLDEEITITNEEDILKMAGVRRKQEGRSAKIITEEIILPKGVYADSLKIGRTRKGIMIIQEPWKF